MAVTHVMIAFTEPKSYCCVYRSLCYPTPIHISRAVLWDPF